MSAPPMLARGIAAVLLASAGLAAGQEAIPVPALGAPAASRPPAPTPPPAAFRTAPAEPAEAGAPRLSDLEKLLKDGDGPLEVNLVFPDVEEIGEPQLIRGAAVAEALALRGGDRPMIFSSDRQPKEGMFNVLVGGLDALRLYIPAEIGKKTAHGLLRVQPYAGPLPLLVVSGATQAGVDDAIFALGFVNQKLPDSGTASIRGVQIPASPPFMRRTPLFPGSTRTFQEMLERDPGALRLAADGAIALDVFLSAMVEIPTKAELQVDLHFLLRQRAFANSGGLGVLVNGAPVDGLSPADIAAAATGGSAGVVSIPVNRFLPGRNEILFQPDGMVGQTATPETFAIYADSAIVFPRVEGNVPLPDLRTTTRTLFPLVGQPDGSEISVLVGSRDLGTIHAAWTFLAKLAQMANTLLYRASVGFDRLDPRLHQIVIAPSAVLPETYRGGIAESWLDDSVGRGGETETPLAKREVSKNLQSFLESQARRLMPTPTPAPQPEKGRRVPDLRSACLASMPNPATAGRWALILGARDAATLETRTSELVRPEFWSRIDGVAVLWNADPAAMHRFVPGAEAKPKQSALADRDVRLPFGERMSRNLWALLCAGLFVILVLLTLRLLRFFDADVEARKSRPLFGHEKD